MPEALYFSTIVLVPGSFLDHCSFFWKIYRARTLKSLSAITNVYIVNSSGNLLCPYIEKFVGDYHRIHSIIDPYISIISEYYSTAHSNIVKVKKM
jgi:hypothetical protein